MAIGLVMPVQLAQSAALVQKEKTQRALVRPNRAQPHLAHYRRTRRTVLHHLVEYRIPCRTSLSFPLGL